LLSCFQLTLPAWLGSRSSKSAETRGWLKCAASASLYVLSPLVNVMYPLLPTQNVP
jgi:hypothetical protein